MTSIGMAADSKGIPVHAETRRTRRRLFLFSAFSASPRENGTLEHSMDSVTIDTQHLHIEGQSRAGHETWFRVRELNAAFDIGRCPDQLVGTSDIFVTHAHLDHAVGIPFYAGQRQLHRMTGGRVYVPADAAEGMREIMTIYERITGATFDEVEVIGLAVGDVVRLGRTHEVGVHRATHRVAANADEVLEVRHRLRDEFAGREERESVELRARGA